MVAMCCLLFLLHIRKIQVIRINIHQGHGTDTETDEEEKDIQLIKSRLKDKYTVDIVTLIVY